MASIKKLGVSFLAAALLAVGAMALVGCGPSDEEVVRQGVSAELDKLKNLDDETLELLATESGADDFAEYGIDAKEFVSNYLSGFDYRIEDVSVDGSNATATVVLTCKSFSQFASSLEDATAALIEDESIADLSSDELNAKIGELVMGALAEVPTAETEPVELSFTLQDHTWTPSSDIDQAIPNALFNN